MNNLIKVIYGIILSLAAVFIVFFSIYLYNNDFIRAVKKHGLDFLYPSLSLKDDSGNLYIVDNSSKRILKIDNTNTLQYIIFGGKKEGKSFYDAVNIAVDKNENLYVVNQVLDEFGFYTVREEIVRYNKNGKYDKVIFQKTRTERDCTPQDVQRSSIASIFSINDNVIWYEVNKDGVFSYIFNILTGRITYKQMMKFENANVYISNVAYYDDDSLLYTNKTGEIYLYSQEKGEKLIYNDDNILPFDIVKSKAGNIYFSDILNKTIIIITGGADVVNLLKNEQPNKFGILINDIYYKLSVSSKETLLINNDRFVVELSNDGEILYIENLSSIPVKYFIRAGMYYAALVISVLAFIILLIYCYRRILKRKVSVIIKQVLIYVPIIIIAIVLTSSAIYNNLTKRYENLLNEQIASMLQIISISINGDDLNNINSHLDFMNESYVNLKENIMKLLNYNKDPWNKAFYFTLHKEFDGNIYSIMFLNDSITAKHPFNYLNEPGGIYHRAMEGILLIEKSDDAWGSWFYGVAPLFDSSGGISGLIEIGKDNVAYENANRILLNDIIKNIVIITLVMISLLSVVSYFVLITLKNLKNGAASIAEGKYDVYIHARGNDELTALTHSFNNMAKNINNFVNDIVTYNKAYHRFVPEEFLKFLNKENIKEVRLGDQVEKDMTVMFSDIIGFTTLSEKLTPAENFNFINSYLSLVGPSVRQNSGFIDKYIGDSIMALYPNTPDDALKTALEILVILNDFNRDLVTKGHNPIGAGFGIHTGRLMLGILGEKERVDSTVISDNVNLTSRLEGLTRKFASAIIISGDSYNKLRRKDLYIVRNLGSAKVKGKEDSVRIYEVLDGLKASEKQERIKYLASFEKGVKYYEELNFSKAFALFNELLKKCPSDATALNFYIKMCKTAHREKYTKGVLVLTDK